MNNYEILRTAGEGAFGVVLKCKDRRSGSPVAIKKIKRSNKDEECKEVSLLRELREDNIVQLRDSFTRKSTLYLVFEFVDQNMLQIIQKSPAGLGPTVTRNYAYQLLKAVAACHHRNIVHRDIKPENMLVTKDNVLKLCDFGYASRTSNGSVIYADFIATRWYRSPEVLLGAACGKDADIWSVGCIIAEMADGKPLFPGQSELDQLHVIQTILGPLREHQINLFYSCPRYAQLRLPPVGKVKGVEKRFRQKICAKLLDLMKCLLSLDARTRYDVIEALKHKVFIPEKAMDVRSSTSTTHIGGGVGVYSSTPSVGGLTSVGGSLITASTPALHSPINSSSTVQGRAGLVYSEGHAAHVQRHSVALRLNSTSSVSNDSLSTRRSNTVSEKSSPKVNEEKTRAEVSKMSYRDAHTSKITVDAKESSFGETGKDGAVSNRNSNNNTIISYQYSPIKPNSKHEKKSSFIEDAIKNFWTNLDDVTLSPISDQPTNTPTAVEAEEPSEDTVLKTAETKSEAPIDIPSDKASWANDSFSIPFADEISDRIKCSSSILSASMGSATIQPLLKLDLLSVDGDPITDERNNFVSAPVTPSEMPDSPEVMDAMENGFGELLFPQEGYGGKEKGSFDYRSSACFQDARLSNTQVSRQLANFNRTSLHANISNNLLSSPLLLPIAQSSARKATTHCDVTASSSNSDSAATEIKVASIPLAHEVDDFEDDDDYVSGSFTQTESDQSGTVSDRDNNSGTLRKSASCDSNNKYVVETSVDSGISQSYRTNSSRVSFKENLHPHSSSHPRGDDLQSKYEYDCGGNGQTEDCENIALADEEDDVEIIDAPVVKTEISSISSHHQLLSSSCSPPSWNKSYCISPSSHSSSATVKQQSLESQSPLLQSNPPHPNQERHFSVVDSHHFSSRSSTGTKTQTYQPPNSFSPAHPPPSASDIHTFSSVSSDFTALEKCYVTSMQVTLNFGENDSQMGTRIDSSLSSSSTRKSTLTPPTNHTPFMNATVVTTAKQMQLACNQTHSSNVKSETPPTSAADFRSRDNYDNVVSATTSDMRPPSNAVRMRNPKDAAKRRAARENVSKSMYSELPPSSVQMDPNPTYPSPSKAKHSTGSLQGSKASPSPQRSNSITHQSNQVSNSSSVQNLNDAAATNNESSSNYGNGPHQKTSNSPSPKTSSTSNVTAPSSSVLTSPLIQPQAPLCTPAATRLFEVAAASSANSRTASKKLNEAPPPFPLWKVPPVGEPFKIPPLAKFEVFDDESIDFGSSCPSMRPSVPAPNQESTSRRRKPNLVSSYTTPLPAHFPLASLGANETSRSRDHIHNRSLVGSPTTERDWPRATAASTSVSPASNDEHDVVLPGKGRRKGSIGSTSNERSPGSGVATPRLVDTRTATMGVEGATSSGIEGGTSSFGPRLEMFKFLNRSARKTIDIRRSCSFESISDHKPVKKTSLGLNLFKQIAIKRIRKTTAGNTNQPTSP